MPKDEGLVREIAEKTEDFVLIFLLPVFFAYSGLRTQIGLLNCPELWLLCAAVVAVAIIGKYFGTYAAARVSGIEKREASALGWLMNTRGLTELIVLNIGLSLGVISPLYIHDASNYGASNYIYDIAFIGMDLSEAAD